MQLTQEIWDLFGDAQWGWFLLQTSGFFPTFDSEENLEEVSPGRPAVEPGELRPDGTVEETVICDDHIVMINHVNYMIF